MNTTTTTPATSTAHRNFRLSIVRTVAVGILASGAAVVVGGVFADSASAGPILLPFPQVTLPPKTTTTSTTIKIKVPPYVTIPPVIVLDPGTPPTTVAPTTVPPTTATPTTVAPTTVAPKPPTTKKPTTKQPQGTGVQVESAGQDAPAETIAPATDPAVAQPVVAAQPSEEQVLAASGSDPITLGADDSLPVLPIAGGALAAAAALVAGGLAYDKRRRA